MKLTTFLLIVTFFNVGATNYAQNTKITLNFNNVTIERVLNEIEFKTEFKFLFNRKDIDVNKLVSVNVKREKLKNILNKMFINMPVSFEVLKKQIIIKSTPEDKKRKAEIDKIKQQRDIKGKIIDERGEPLPGATIQIKGTIIGTTSDFDGNYYLQNIPADALSLIFSYVGFAAQVIEISDQTVINITLKDAGNTLEEIVVVGYTKQKKINVTGAVSALKGEELASKPMSDARQALQGVAAGLTIIDRGGAPGEETLGFKIRGIGSVSAGTSPLVLIDGLESTLSEINPHDIESISILKDAASSSIYGSRAANGVVLITTKRGTEGDYKINYNSYLGWQTPATLPELVGAEDYLNLVNESLINAGRPIKYSDEYIQNTISGVDPIAYPYTNIFKELFNTSFVQNHAVSIRGGGKNSTIALSVNYLDQEGMLKNTGSKKLGTRLNADYKLSDAFTLRTNLYYNNRETLKPNKYGEALSAMVGTSPVNILKYPNGAYGLNKDNSNALAALEVSGENLKVVDDLSLNVGLDYKITQNLTLSTDYSYLKKDIRIKNFEASYDFNDPNDLSNIIYQWGPNKLFDSRWGEKQTNFKSILHYDIKLNDDHQINLLGGIDITENIANYLFGSRQNIYSNDSPELNTGDLESKNNGGYSQDWALMSYLGRFNYSYKSKYLFEANLRYDGSSRFGKGHKWGLFPSFSTGWNMSKEDFMSDISFIKSLKLRGSWGQLGNQDIGLYRFSSNISTFYTYSFDDVEVNGYSQSTYANEEITWETSEMTNIGIDLSLFRGKLDITADWFHKKTKDMLLNLPISPLVGLDSSEINIGSVSNKGWEFALKFRDNINDFNYSIGVNMSDVKNELTDFGGEAPSISGWTVIKKGESLNSFYGYTSDGLFQTQEEIDNHPTQPNHSNLKPGDIKLVDQLTVDTNGDGIPDEADGVINDDDRSVIGSSIPRYQYGFNFSSDYKNFDLNLFFQGVLKAENYFYGAPNEGPSYEIFTTTRVLDRWTPENTNASFPRLEAASNKNNYLYSDFWIRDAAYLRLKNIQVGYTLPQYVVDKLKIDRFRIYTGATNLFTITDVESGLDPETYNGRPSYYPPTSTYTLGVQVTF